MSEKELESVPIEAELPEFVDKIFLEDKWLQFKALLGGDSVDTAIQNLEQSLGILSDTNKVLIDEKINTIQNAFNQISTEPDLTPYSSREMHEYPNTFIAKLDATLTQEQDRAGGDRPGRPSRPVTREAGRSVLG